MTAAHDADVMTSLTTQIDRFPVPTAITPEGRQLARQQRDTA